MNVGDLVRIQSGFCYSDDAESDWVGIVVEMVEKNIVDDNGEGEWLILWAHSPTPANEFAYYLEVICK